jgi:molybdopterin-biosynthesis enzyme MoeA-like protein
MKPRVAAKTYPYALSDPEPWPCIVKDFKVGITTGVPSIMHADEKMWEEYYQNLAKSVSINHIQKTNVTTIVLNEVDIQSYNENVMRIS